MNLSVQQFWKLFSIWRGYGQKSSVLFFGSQCILAVLAFIISKIIAVMLSVDKLRASVIETVYW